MRSFMTCLSVLGLIALYLTMWPTPVSSVSWQAPENKGYIDEFSVNNKLSSVELISLNGEEGPEDFAVNSQGDVFFALLGGKVMKIDAENNISEFANTGGRPLGIEFAPNGDLIVADAYKGLLSISKEGEVNLLTDSVIGSQIRYADDVDITSEGIIYFSDASTKFSAKEYGTYAASLLDIMEHGGHGRVLKFNPETQETSVVVGGLQFANGISISHEEDAVLINETGSYRVLKHWISGDKAGTTDVILENLPGFPDNINKGNEGRYWLGLVSPRSDALDALSGHGRIRDAVQRLPAQLRPKAQLYGHVLAIDGNGTVLTSLQDPETTYSYTTGAVENGPWLYVSSLHEKKIARLKVPSL